MLRLHRISSNVLLLLRHHAAKRKVLLPAPSSSRSLVFLPCAVRCFSSDTRKLPKDSKGLIHVPINQIGLEEERDYMDEEHHGGDDDEEDNEDDDDDDDEDETGKLPWRTLLEQPARAKWRAASEYPPEHLFLAQEVILEKGGRNRKQVRKAFQRILESHSGLASRRERERTRANARAKVTDSLAYKNELKKDISAETIYYTPEFTLASLHQRLLPNYAVITRVLNETKSLLGPKRFQPRRVIDFGIGCGSASAAALDAFGTIDWIHGIDPSQSMRDCAKLLIEDIVKERTPSARLTLGESLTSDSSGGGTFDLALCTYTATELPHVASMLAAAATLWEKLKPNGIFIMIEPGTPDGFNSIRSVRTMLLDCCPPRGNFEDEMEGDDQCHIIAPCTHSGKCPMHRHKSTNKRRVVTSDVQDETQAQDLANDEDDNDDGEDSWEFVQTTEEDEVEEFNIKETQAFGSSFCSFVHTIPGSAGRGEKFSYLVAQKRILGDHIDEQIGKEHYSFADVNVVNLLKDTYKTGRAASVGRKLQRRAVEEERHFGFVSDAQDLEERYLECKDDSELGLQLLRGDERRSSFGRIIRAPIKRKGLIYVDYCGGNLGNENGDGRIIRHKVSKGFSRRVVPGQFQAARKARWGGLWPDVSFATVDLELLSSAPKVK